MRAVQTNMLAAPPDQLKPTTFHKNKPFTRTYTQASEYTLAKKPRRSSSTKRELNLIRALNVTHDRRWAYGDAHHWTSVTQLALSDVLSEWLLHGNNAANGQSAAPRRSVSDWEEFTACLFFLSSLDKQLLSQNRSRTSEGLAVKKAQRQSTRAAAACTHLL